MCDMEKSPWFTVCNDIRKIGDCVVDLQSFLGMETIVLNKRGDPSSSNVWLQDLQLNLPKLKSACIDIENTLIGYENVNFLSQVPNWISEVIDVLNGWKSVMPKKLSKVVTQHFTELQASIIIFKDDIEKILNTERGLVVDIESRINEFAIINLNRDFHLKFDHCDSRTSEWLRERMSNRVVLVEMCATLRNVFNPNSKEYTPEDSEEKDYLEIMAVKSIDVAVNSIDEVLVKINENKKLLDLRSKLTLNHGQMKDSIEKYDAFMSTKRVHKKPPAKTIGPWHVLNRLTDILSRHIVFKS